MVVVVNLDIASICAVASVVIGILQLKKSNQH